MEDQPIEDPTPRQRTLRDFPTPPYLKGLGSTASVRTPLGHYRTESLFLERWRPMESERPLFTLYRVSREDPKVPGSYLPSFMSQYIKLGDPTGYKAAMDLLGDWEHWKKLNKCPWFKEHLDLWNEEIVAKLRTQGLDTFVREAGKGDLKAAEWLVSYTPDGPPPRSGRGRPTKADITRAAREAAEQKDNLRDDARRLGIND